MRNIIKDTAVTMLCRNELKHFLVKYARLFNTFPQTSQHHIFALGRKLGNINQKHINKEKRHRLYIPVLCIITIKANEMDTVRADE